VIPGAHCESSAITNALRYEGYDVTECMVTGGGSALSFMFRKGLFPWLGGRNTDMRERFFDAAGIAWHKSLPEDSDTGWGEIAGLLERGIPVMLRVDMRFLPYRYEGKYGPRYMSFGWHIITLFGIDYDRGLAYVSDTEFDSLQSVKLADLHKARISKTKNWPPRAEFYWAEKSQEGFRIEPDRLVRASLEGVLENYRGKASDVMDGANGDVLVGLSGLGRFAETLAHLETWSDKKFLLPAVLEYMAGTIEDFGSGGAAFRVLYRDFLVYAGDRSAFGGIDSLIPSIDASIASWHALSAEFRRIASSVKGMDADERAKAWLRCAKIAEDLYRSEQALYTAIEATAREE